MEQKTPVLPDDLERLWGKPAEVAHGSAYEVDDYPELVRTVARLAYRNPTQVLFFRGQAEDYEKRGGASTFYPTIYRGDNLKQQDVQLRFSRLENAERLLVERFREQQVDGVKDLERRQYVRWSILQHYKVCDTPLLDLTHSLSVACSFAQLEAYAEDRVYVYAFLLPFSMNRISINSEENLVNIRLLSICPPAAPRPFFQEGYLTGTTDITSNYPNKQELDWNRRLAAKFAIPNNETFWTPLFGPVPQRLLMPKDDLVRDVVRDIGGEAIERSTPGALGEFLRTWIGIEEDLRLFAAELDPTMRTVHQAIEVLAREEWLGSELASSLDSLRRFRNSVIHGARTPSESEILERLGQANWASSELGKVGPPEQ